MRLGLCVLIKLVVCRAVHDGISVQDSTSRVVKRGFHIKLLDHWLSHGLSYNVVIDVLFWEVYCQWQAKCLENKS